MKAVCKTVQQVHTDKSLINTSDTSIHGISHVNMPPDTTATPTYLSYF